MQRGKQKGATPSSLSGAKRGGHGKPRKEVVMQPKTITLYEFEITRIELPYIYFRVRCSKGTYIRSLAYDFGKRLNNGAYLYALRRTRIGNYKADDALSVDEFLKQLTADN